MAAEQQPNGLEVEEKVPEPILRRCSRLKNKSQAQSDDPEQQQHELQSHICPPQAKQNQKMAERADRPSTITNITLQQKNTDLTVLYTDAKQKKKRGMLFDLLETWGIFILTIIFVYFCANGGKTNELFWEFVGRMEETWIEVDWILPPVGSYLLIKGKEDNCIAQVVKIVAPKHGYSWELCDIPVIEVQYVNTEVKKSNNVILLQGNGSTDMLCVFDYLPIDISGLDQSAVHGYLVIESMTNKTERLEMTIENLNSSLESVSESMWTVVIKKLRSSIQFRAKDKWRHGFLWFTMELWNIWLNELNDYHVNYNFEEDGNHVSRVLVDDITEYHKIWEREEFEKIVCGDRDIVGTISRLEFEYNDNTHMLSFAAFIVVDD